MPLEPHARFGPYEIVAPLGAGGMGEVYRARDTNLGREVAIKVLRDSFARDPDRLHRFEREARLLATLNHPHIGAIYGVEESNGIRALVLELIEGPTLADCIARGALALTEALPIARQIADGLEAAHQQGIVHRDLKPANIKVRSDGTVKVLDFGLAKAWAGDGSGPDLSESPTVTARGTLEGVILGTAAYMSPEQARGKPLDKRTDIWSFGCVLFEMLTGRRPFGGDTVSDTISAILGREPDWGLLPKNTPASVRRLLRRCLEKNAKRRLHDIADARIEIDDAIASDPTDKTLTEVSPDRTRRFWRILAVVSLVALITLATFTIAPRMRQVTAPAWSTAQTVATQLTNYGGTEAGGALSPDGRSFVFVSNHGGTPDMWLRQVSGGDPVRLTNDEAEERDPIYAPDGETIYFTRVDANRGAIWHMGALGGQARLVVSKARFPAPSPDGRSLAFVVGDALVVSAVDGSGRRTLVEGNLTGTAVTPQAWSPDSRWISYTPRGLFAPVNLFVVDVSTGQKRQVTQFAKSGERVDSQAWLPDNRHLVVSYSSWPAAIFWNDLGILDIQDGSIRRLSINVAQALAALSVSADGSRLIATSSQTQRELWKAPLGPDPEANGRAAIRLMDSAKDPMWTFVTRDGRTLLFNNATTGSRNLWTMPLDGRAPPRQITSIAGDAVMNCSLSPDGSHVAFASRATGNSDIWTQNVDGSDLRQLTNDDSADSWPVWSPDGRWIVFSSFRSGRPETWRVPATGGPSEKVVDGFWRGDWISQPTGTGTWIATSANGVRLIDFERRTTLWEKPIPGAGLSLPMFSPDGRFISFPHQVSRDRDAISIFESATGKSRVAVRFPGPFRIFFRANWVDDGKALVVNRYHITSHIVLFDRFWLQPSAQSR